jgi:hypothetical protein
MKQKFWFLVIGCIVLCTASCTKREMVMILEDICRDTYEKSTCEKRIDNLDNPAYEKPPTYDQYQRERKNL